ncbi:hypothetical protein [Amycolatopsis sp. w19]|uniref:hypothetical protein n=1 Tax=Amycolatopsis sp. w19 TaxID=3448134 RepID=UPI003F1B7BA8
MEERPMGDAGPPRVPHPREHFAAFPGPVVAASTGMGVGPIAEVGTDQVNDQPWAIGLGYTNRDRKLKLMIRTVRPAEQLDPRGRPIENVEIQLHNFLARTAPRDHGAPAPTRADLDAKTERVRTALADATATPVTITINNLPVAGTRTDALGTTVIETLWNSYSVLITSTPDHLGTVELHTATPADVAHL